MIGRVVVGGERCVSEGDLFDLNIVRDRKFSL